MIKCKGNNYYMVCIIFERPEGLRRTGLGDDRNPTLPQFALKVVAGVESTDREEDTGERNYAKDLPVEPAVIEPEGGPVFKSDPDPLGLRLELFAAVLTLPRKARPGLRPNSLPVLSVRTVAVPVAAVGTICAEKVRSRSVSFRGCQPPFYTIGYV
jgi:hypothetical protein